MDNQTVAHARPHAEAARSTGTSPPGGASTSADVESNGHGPHVEPSRTSGSSPPTPKEAVEVFGAALARTPDPAARAALHKRADLLGASKAAPEVLAAGGLRGRLASALLRYTPAEPDWLVPGLIARGWMVKLAAREKVGKGTFVFYLIGRLERGEPTVFGDATEPVSAVIYTEEPEDSTREKADAMGLARSRVIFGWELADLGTWEAKVAHLVDTAVEEGHGLLFVDNISRAAEIQDESGVELARAGEMLSNAAKAEGLAVLIDHHHRKGAGRLEDKSRGTTAIAGACENNVEMERVGDWTSPIRKLSSRGRRSTTIWERRIALAKGNGDYENVGEGDDLPTARDRHRLDLLRASAEGMTVKDFAAAAGIGRRGAGGALAELVTRGRATVDKSGQPHVYHARDESPLGLDGPNS